MAGARLPIADSIDDSPRLPQVLYFSSSVMALSRPTGRVLFGGRDAETQSESCQKESLLAQSFPIMRRTDIDAVLDLADPAGNAYRQMKKVSNRKSSVLKSAGSMAHRNSGRQADERN